MSAYTIEESMSSSGKQEVVLTARVNEVQIYRAGSMSFNPRPIHGTYVFHLKQLLSSRSLAGNISPVVHGAVYISTYMLPLAAVALAYTVSICRDEFNHPPLIQVVRCNKITTSLPIEKWCNCFAAVDISAKC